MRAIRFPFRFTGTTIDVTSDYNEIVRGQVIDALMTNQGERVMRPTYGVDAQSTLFDPRDELVRRDAAGIIRTRLETFVPRCAVRDIHIELPPESSLIYIVISYRPSLTSPEVTLTVPVNTTTGSYFVNTATANFDTTGVLSV